MSPGDRLAVAARLAEERETLARSMARARKPARHEGRWGREVRERELAGLEARAVDVDAELVALAEVSHG